MQHNIDALQSHIQSLYPAPLPSAEAKQGAEAVLALLDVLLEVHTDQSKD